MGAEEKQLADKVRFNAQCFLIDNWQKIVPYNVKRTEKENYKNFIIVQGDPGLVTHELTGKRGIEELMEIRTEQISFLVPSIKIWKVQYPDEGGKREIQKQLRFRDHTSGKTIENITKTRIGRGDDVGLKSFSYELAGKNVSEGGIATCKLVILFQNVGSLVADADEGSAAFKDLLIQEPRFIKKGAKSGQTTKDEKDKDGSTVSSDRIYNQEHFRIKVVSGWADPIDPSGAIIPQSLLKQIRLSRTILFLTLFKHDLSFNDDGSVELTLEYHGSIEAALSDPKSDLLTVGEYGKEAQKIRKDLASGEKETQSINAKKPNTKINTNSKQQDVSGFDKSGFLAGEEEARKSNERAKATQLESLDKQERYSRVLKELYDKQMIYYIDIDKDHVKGFDDIVREELSKKKYNLDEKTRKFAEAYFTQLGRRSFKELKIVRMKRATTYEERNKAGLQSSNRALDLAKEISKTERYGISWAIGGSTDTVTIKREDLAKKVESQALDAQPQTPADKNMRRINFFFFGDLLEVALSVLKDRTDIRNMSVLVGPIIFKDPRNPNGEVQAVNLADIPISLDLFNVWYSRQVIAPLREKYYFDKFIKDAISTLIIPALGDACFIQGPNQQQTISMTTFTVPAKDGKNPLYSFAEIDKNNNTIKNNRVDINERKLFLKDKNKTFEQTTHQDVVDLHHFLYIYVSSWRTMNLNGTREANEKAGIYHLYPAADRGLVKNIKFSKQNQPFLDEHNATKDSDDVKRLTFRYNASVTMVGNTLFRPGMYVYIDTARFGLGTPMKPSKNDKNNATFKNSIASELGLGGYYQVTKISQNVGQDDYETEIECQWIYAGGEQMKVPVQKFKDSEKAFGRILKTSLKTKHGW